MSRRQIGSPDEEADRIIARARRVKRICDVLLWGAAIAAVILLATGHR